MSFFFVSPSTHWLGHATRLVHSSFSWEAKQFSGSVTLWFDLSYGVDGQHWKVAVNPERSATWLARQNKAFVLSLSKKGVWILLETNEVFPLSKEFRKSEISGSCTYQLLCRLESLSYLEIHVHGLNFIELYFNDFKQVI